jgi:hypothetical protein
VSKADVIADNLATYADTQGWSQYDSVVLAFAYRAQRAELDALMAVLDVAERHLLCNDTETKYKLKDAIAAARAAQEGK